MGFFDFIRGRQQSSSSQDMSIVGGVIMSGGKVVGGPKAMAEDAGVVEKRSFLVENFEQLEASGSLTVEWVRSEGLFCEAEADTNVLGLIKAEMRGDKLAIFIEGSFCTQAGIVVRVGSPSLRSASLAGSGRLSAEGLAGESFSASLVGSGTMELRGEARESRLTLAGSGTIEAADLSALNLEATCQGSGRIKATASRRADAILQGSGDIKVCGGPEVQNQTIQGSGSIKFVRKGPKP